MDRKTLIQKLQSTSPERVKDYLDILDRVFLQALVYKMLEQDDVKNVLNYWQSQLKLEINFESCARNEFLMGSPIGRMVALSDELEDGESLRLNNIKAMNVAKEIAFHNYLKPEDQV